MIWEFVVVYLCGAVLAYGVALGTSEKIDSVGENTVFSLIMGAGSWVGFVCVLIGAPLNGAPPGFQLWRRSPEPMAASYRPPNHILPTYAGSIHDMAERWKDEPDWNVPTGAERAYALSTMPGKATGHVIGYRQWNLRIKVDMEYPPAAMDIAAMSQAERWAEAMRLYQSWAEIDLRDTVRLTGLTFSQYDWEPGQPAIGNCSSVAMPSVGRGPGLYALKESPRRGDVWGEVALWGDVVEHENGYRARYAYPVRLYVNADASNAEIIARALREAYGVPAEVAQKQSTRDEELAMQMLAAHVQKQLDAAIQHQIGVHQARSQMHGIAATLGVIQGKSSGIQWVDDSDDIKKNPFS